jgi:hypothetical protein
MKEIRRTYDFTTIIIIFHLLPVFFNCTPPIGNIPIPGIATAPTGFFFSVDGESAAADESSVRFNCDLTNADLVCVFFRNVRRKVSRADTNASKTTYLFFHIVRNRVGLLPPDTGHC